jgi:hypothetical protein
MGRQRIKVKGVQNKYNEDHRINFVRKSKTALNCTSIEILRGNQWETILQITQSPYEKFTRIPILLSSYQNHLNKRGLIVWYYELVSKSLCASPQNN